MKWKGYFGYHVGYIPANMPSWQQPDIVDSRSDCTLCSLSL